MRSLLLIHTRPGDQHRENNATTNPFLEQKFRISEYTAQEIATLQSRLERQLGPEYISTRPGAGGGKVHYLAAEKVINLANEVFGFNGWSSSIQNVQVDFVDEHPQSGKITLGLSTIVRVTLRDGAFHEDVGYGHIENCKGKAAAFEKAKKESATDALKRALRNFGNVLGNCLYDKDYLAKVQKIKVAPSRWDAGNLHRHPDFAPIKRTSLAEADAQSEKVAAAKRQLSAQSAMSMGSTEFEDDFGGNAFDETDFTHPDEVRLREAAVQQNSAAGPQAHALKAAQQRQSVPRMQSMPPSRPANGQPLSAGPNTHMPQRAAVPPPPQYGAPQGQAARMPPPHPTVHHPRLGQTSTILVQNQGDGASGSNSSSGTAVDTPAPQKLQEHLAMAPPGNQPPGVPEGFVTGRNADLLNQATEAPPPPGVNIAFNPHADSPSIRRTHGINPGKSVPITRSSVLGTANSGRQSEQHQPPGVASRDSNVVTPVRGNYLNPAADPGRRIGMPSGGTGGFPNRSAYKPPSAAGAGVKRPPLGDVSNLQQMDGANDVKKPRPSSPNPITAPTTAFENAGSRTRLAEGG